MKLSQLSKKKWIYDILAFIIPCLGMLAVILVKDCIPFGKKSMLYSDMYHQYYPFFKAFRQALLSGDSLLFNWDIGLGVDYLGLFSYYLASPLNLLTVFIPESWMLGYFAVLTPIKLGFASMFFGIFLKKISGKKDFSTVLFGSFYGLCAWALGYQWNIMWLDTFALLPLVMTGMISLLKERKFILYTITLFLSIYINYYIGFFVCIFVFLSFICYEICRWKSFSSFIADLSRIAVFSLLAIGMTAIISLPTLASLKTTYSSVNKFPEGFQLNMTTENNWQGLFETMARVAGNTYGGIPLTLKEGLPNLYCGIFTIILSILYLFCKGIRIRDKICSVILLLFLNISFIVRQLDYIWHGFHFTNMIPYRFSFLYSFVMLYMAYIAWTKRNSFRLWQIFLATIPAIGMIFCYQDWGDIAFWAYNGFAIMLYITVLIFYCTFRSAPTTPNAEQIVAYVRAHSLWKRACSGILLVIMAIEIAFNLVNYGVSFPITDIEKYPYPRGTVDTESVIQYMKEQENGTPFYRAEVTHTQTLNDGALNGYHGITTFTSSANVKVTEYMRQLGYGAKDNYNRYSYEEASPVSNLFLGLKYMIERDDKVETNPYFDDIYQSGDVHLLKNNAYLPLGFLANSQLLNVNFKGNRFDFQNKLIRESTGILQNVWYQMPGNTLTISSNDPEIIPQTSTGYCTFSSQDDMGTITYTYTANRAGLMCIDLELYKVKNFYIYINNNLLSYDSYSLPQMASVCEVEPGDVVQIKLKCNKANNGVIKVKAGILNEDVFRNAHQKLSESVLNIAKFSNTLIEGTINCKKTGILYTSIPQNGNWFAEVDGKPVDTVTINDAMVGLMLTEGQHTVRFIYRNASFSLGWKVSLFCFLAFIAIIIVAYKPTLPFIKKKKNT